MFGDNGLVSRSEKASEEHRAGTLQDEVSMWKDEKAIAKYSGESAMTRDALIDDQVARGLLTAEEAQTAKDTGSVKIGSQTINYGSDARTLVEMYDAGELKIGDYLNYQNPSSGTYTVSGSKTGMQNCKDNGYTVADEDLNQVYNVANNQLNWRILGKDSSGGLKLIAGSPMKKETTSNNPYLMMYGAQAYITGVEELNNICSMYKNEYATTARSVNIEDVNSITGVTTEDKIKEVNLDYYHRYKQYGDAYSFENDYTPESWLNGKTQTTVSGTVDGYRYSVNSLDEEGAPYVTMTDTDLYNLLFNNIENRGGKAYWLASSGVRDNSGYAIFGLGAVESEDEVTIVGSGVLMSISVSGSEYGGGLAVRPVVVLKSDVTEENMQKITGSEETWNYSGEGVGWQLN